MPRGLTSSRNLLVLTVLGLLVLSLAPIRYSGWVRGLRNPIDVAVRPISGPFAALSVWLRPGNRRGGASEEDQEVERQRDQFKWLYLRELDRVVELESLVRDLQGGAWARPPGVRRIEAQRVGADIASGTIDVARGSGDGVRPGAVAVARRSEQLVGIATDIRPGVTTFRLLTHRAPRSRLLVVGCVGADAPLTSAQLQDLPRCQFEPVGDGTLADTSVGAEAAARIAPGMIVRVVDDTWSDAARMLVLGRVARVEDSPNPLFKRVVIRPDTDIARVRSVIVQSPGNAGGAGIGGRP